MKRSGRFASDDLIRIDSATPPGEWAAFGDRVVLNSGGPELLVVDCVDVNLVVAGPEGEWTLPAACFRRLPR